MIKCRKCGIEGKVNGSALINGKWIPITKMHINGLVSCSKGGDFEAKIKR